VPKLLLPLVQKSFRKALRTLYSRQRLGGQADGTGAFAASRSTGEPHGLQRARAGEPGRGRHAQAPWHIPLKGWKDIFWRTYQQIGEDRLLAVAAGVVFYGLLAVFPAVTALVSLYGLFASPAAISDQLALLSGILPDSAVEILRAFWKQRWILAALT
jgi:membrane protein